MNRNKKLISLVILSIILILIAINFNKIEFTLNLLSLYNKERDSLIISDSDNKPNDSAKNPLGHILDSNNNNNNKDKEISDIGLNTVGNLDHEESSQVTIRKPSQSKTSSIPKSKDISHGVDNSKSYITIISEYNNLLLDMKSDFEADLDSLIQEGIKEYSYSNDSKSKLANKYLSLGSDLEKDSDEKFNKLLKDMEKELKENNHSTSIVKDTVAYYTSFKETKKSEIINKGMSHLK